VTTDSLAHDALAHGTLHHGTPHEVSQEFCLPGFAVPDSFMWMPPSGEALVHVLEDVHMTLFLAMVVYFLVMRWGLIRLDEKLHTWRHAEEAARSGDTTGSKVLNAEINHLRRRLVCYYVGDKDLDGTVGPEERDKRLKHAKNPQLVERVDRIIAAGLDNLTTTSADAPSV
jgi:hypothetical protein